MRIITLEEHFLSKHAAEIGDHYFRSFNTGTPQLNARLEDIGEERIADMDKNGINVQILSHTVASPEILEAKRAILMCARFNDELAEAVAKFPKRFAGFASLPTADPQAAATELERAVRQLGFVGGMIQGVTQGRFLDDPHFTPLLERAEELDVPLYLHPAPPPEPVMQAYYSGLQIDLARMLAIAGWGWHSETALHSLRLITNQVFERHPKLQIIIGHMGEMLPFQLARIDKALGRFFPDPAKPPTYYFRNYFHITTSGLFTTGPLNLTIEMAGIDRTLFSIDYPYSSNEAGRAFLDEIKLSPADFDKFTHKNAERLLKLPPA